MPEVGSVAAQTRLRGLPDAGEGSEDPGGASSEQLARNYLARLCDYLDLSFLSTRGRDGACSVNK